MMKYFSVSFSDVMRNCFVLLSYDYWHFCIYSIQRGLYLPRIPCSVSSACSRWNSPAKTASCWYRSKLFQHRISIRSSHAISFWADLAKCLTRWVHARDDLFGQSSSQARLEFRSQWDVFFSLFHIRLGEESVSTNRFRWMGRTYSCSMSRESALAKA